MVSLPWLPYTVSLPARPLRVSLPLKARIWSALGVPLSVSAPSVPSSLESARATPLTTTSVTAITVNRRATRRILSSWFPYGGRLISIKRHLSTKPGLVEDLWVETPLSREHPSPPRTRLCGRPRFGGFCRIRRTLGGRLGRFSRFWRSLGF